MTAISDGYYVVFFFFQAEDGIRDLTVTGVQTCALPISLHGDNTGDLHVPDGFAIEVFAKDLDGVRTLAFGPDGKLYAALSQDGRIVRFDVGSATHVPEAVIGGGDPPSRTVLPRAAPPTPANPTTVPP